MDEEQNAHGHYLADVSDRTLTNPYATSTCKSKWPTNGVDSRENVAVVLLV